MFSKDFSLVLFLSPHFLFSRLIGLHISMCCDSVSFDFIKPATTVARFIQHSCLFIFSSSVPYRKVRNRKCKQNSRRVGPCFEHMPWYKWGFKSLGCFWIVLWNCLDFGRTSLFISPFTLLSLSSCSPFYVKFPLCFHSKCLKDRTSKRRRKPKTFDLLSKQGYYHFVGHCDAFWEICVGLNTFAKIG